MDISQVNMTPEQAQKYTWIAQNSPEHLAQQGSYGESQIFHDPYASFFDFTHPDIAKTLGYTGQAFDTLVDPSGEGDNATVLNPQFKNWLQEQGYQRTFSQVDPKWAVTGLTKEGQLVPGTTYRHYTGPDDFLQQVLQLGLMAFPGVGQTLGGLLGASGIGATALGNALISGTMSEIGGGDFLKGALGGGLGSLGGQLIGPLAGQLGGSLGEFLGSELIGDALTRGLTNAATSGIRAAVGGRDISDALLGGFVSGGVSSGIGDLVDEYFGELPDFITNTGSKLLSDYLTSEILGTSRPSTTQTIIDGITRPSGGAPSGGTSSGGGLGGLESLMMLGMLGQGEQAPQQAPHFARTVKSPFGSILG